MAITLANTIAWAQAYVRFAPLTIGTGNEPALSNANIILSTILGPPFTWNWNRGSASFNTVQGTQDYTQTIATYGFLEKASITQAGNTYEIEIKTCLSDDSQQGQPHTIAPQLDAGSGSITFRILPVPDGVYTVKLTYQKQPSLFLATATAWPIPDRYAYIFQHGFLALSLMYVDDPKFGLENQKFVSHLLGAAEGLDEQAKNIFIGRWMAVTGQSASAKAQQGQASRGQ